MKTCDSCQSGAHEDCRPPCRCGAREHIPETEDLISYVLQAVLAFVTFLVSGASPPPGTSTTAARLGAKAAQQFHHKLFDLPAFVTFFSLLRRAAKEREEVLNRHGVGSPRASQGCPCDKCAPSSDGGEYDNLSTGAEVEHALDAAEKVRGSASGRSSIYFASKTRHAQRWVALRATGLEISSTWIDEAGKGQSISWSDLWGRTFSEIKQSKALVFYGEEGEVQEGTLVEIGAAIASGIPVFWVGPEVSTVRRSDVVTVCETVEEAVGYAKRGWAGRLAAFGDGRNPNVTEDAEGLWREYKKECPGCDDSHRLAFLAGFDREKRSVVITIPTPPDMPSLLTPEHGVRWITFIYREGGQKPTTIGQFSDRDDAEKHYSSAGAQWSDSYLCQVVRGPNDGRPDPVSKPGMNTTSPVSGKHESCGTCVSCSCAASPNLDQDGLCLACGGTPLSVAQLRAVEPGRAAPHVSSEVPSRKKRAVIARLIAWANDVYGVGGTVDLGLKPGQAAPTPVTIHPIVRPIQAALDSVRERVPDAVYIGLSSVILSASRSVVESEEDEEESERRSESSLTEEERAEMLARRTAGVAWPTIMEHTGHGRVATVKRYVRADSKGTAGDEVKKRALHACLVEQLTSWKTDSPTADFAARVVDEATHRLKSTHADEVARDVFVCPTCKTEADPAEPGTWAWKVEQYDAAQAMIPDSLASLIRVSATPGKTEPVPLKERIERLLLRLPNTRHGRMSTKSETAAREAYETAQQWRGDPSPWHLLPRQEQQRWIAGLQPFVVQILALQDILWRVNNILFDATDKFEDPEHQITSHGDSLPYMYRRLAEVAAKAFHVLSVAVLKTMEGEPQDVSLHNLSPSEVVVAKCLAAMQEYAVREDPWETQESCGLVKIVDALSGADLWDPTGPTPEGQALLDRARKARVV